VFFTDVRIPDALRVGEEGQGWQIARTTLGFEHSMGDPTQDVPGGVPGRDITSIVERYAPIADPTLKARMVDAWIEDRVGGCLSAMLRERRRQGHVPGADGSLEKVFHSEHRQRVQDLLIDLGGDDAVAYRADDTWADRSAWAFLRTRTRTIAGGTNEIHRNKIAERLLGLPRDDSFKGVPWRDLPRS
ncbi:MAG TPA: acyl-CoA dehydrogenase family protein, partial [Acidimicrobiales bacterium]|nr:acyl-CoA dehydrogenase family protein [Acidimicrobiales bacterium]